MIGAMWRARAGPARAAAPPTAAASRALGALPPVPVVHGVQCTRAHANACAVRGQPVRRVVQTGELLPQTICKNAPGKNAPRGRSESIFGVIPRCESHRNCVLLTRLTRASIRIDSLARSIRSNWPQCCLACFTARGSASNR